MSRVGSVCLNAFQQAANQPAEPDISSHDYTQLASQVPIDMDVPGAPLRDLPQLRYEAKRRQPKLILIRAAAIMVILVIAAGGFFVGQDYFKLQKVFRANDKAAALNAYVDPNQLKGESSGRVNLLVLGQDGSGYRDPNLTNSLIFVSIDTINHQATMLSLPSDLWVTVPGAGVMTLNHAWQSAVSKYGGHVSSASLSNQAINSAFQLTDQTVEDVIGQPIDYNVIINYQALSQAVNSVGGISLNVPAALNDPTMAWQNGGNSVLVNNGQQTLNGNQAIMYVSSKETTNNFDRASRQRAVLQALMSKVVSLGTLGDPLKLSSLLSSFSNNVQTDLSMNLGARLYGIISDITPDNVSSLALGGQPGGSVNYVTNGVVDGQPVVLPSTGLFNYQAIQNYVAGQLKNPFIIKENAKILLLNGTDSPGLATTAANQLKNAGFNVVGAGNTPYAGWTTTALVDLTHDHDQTKAALQKWFHVTAASRLSDNSIPTDGADFVIILGSNETNPT